MPGAENILGCFLYCSKTFRAVRSAQRAVGLLDQFDKPEILDDLMDGWAADVHHGGWVWQRRGREGSLPSTPGTRRGDSRGKGLASTSVVRISNRPTSPCCPRCAADERLQFIRLLQDVALSKKVRVSILSGGRPRRRRRPPLQPPQDQGPEVLQMVLHCSFLLTAGRLRCLGGTAGA